ncbi:putative leucine-rich repeat domain, L domain-containing protein [Rosa chinensis]|uniref:Putative leucine-rich repeat domain, L domain-containing protein n=1 Tax=Rosa chinensis TaxID=74649 RepID=A0A2P6RD25_ROSCH|nr:putative leucine-rich repeat domain, L domain-containing protein [Rosa chinensis]
MVYWTSFSGDIPNSIGNLKMLSSIDISNCNFTGSVPKSIENLTQLADLEMSRNRFNSPISSVNWATLVNLETLDLSNNQLYGTIPSSVVSLPKLETLTLSNNRVLFSGRVPEFSNTSSPLLDTLDWQNNNLDGQIPTSIFNLQGLLFLNLSSNNFSGFPFNGPRLPINLSSVNLSNNSMLFDYNGSKSSFLQIRHLVLASNKLRAFPDFLRNQSILYYLDLSNNQIQGKIPNWILSLKTLNFLDLSGNSLASLEAPLRNSTSALSSLDLHSNKLQGEIPNWILSVKCLNSLDLSGNSLVTLEDPLPNSTSALSSLDLHSNKLQVDLHSNQLQGHFPLFLSSIYLDYSRNNFSSSIPIDIGEFISIGSYLSLSSNNFHGAIPESICNAGARVLDLSNNSLSGNIPQCLTQLLSLSVIDLGRNNLSGTIPDNFLNSCELQTLDLSNNQIQGWFPKSLVNCSRLKVLNIGNNNISDTFPCMLMSISTLHVLVLQSNKFYGSIGCPKTNDTWPVLQIIDLAHNNFNGDMLGRMSLSWQAMVSNDDDSPTNLGYSFQPIMRRNKFMFTRDGYQYDGSHSYYIDAITNTITGSELDMVKILTIFTLIDYSSNKFNGSIPEEIGKLKSLYVLDLSGNAFTGKIPSSFGKMRQLESLDLSKNHLSGQIPPEFANLTFLAFLDLSNNELVGKIPTSTQISTFPNVFSDFVTVEKVIGNVEMMLWMKFGGRRRSWPPHEQCHRNSATVNSAVATYRAIARRKNSYAWSPKQYKYLILCFRGCFRDFEQGGSRRIRMDDLEVWMFFYRFWVVHF